MLLMLGGGHLCFCTSFTVYSAALTFTFLTRTACGRRLTASSDLPRSPAALSELTLEFSQLGQSRGREYVQSKFEPLQAFTALLHAGPAAGFESCSPARCSLGQPSNLAVPDVQRPAGDVARRSFLRAVFGASLTAALAPALPAFALTASATAAPTEQLKVVQGRAGEGNKFSIAVPPGWERPTEGTGRSGQYDDTVFAAIDLVTNHAASVSAIPVDTLLTDAEDDTLKTAGFVASTLADIGKPIYVAKLLTAREQFDPKGNPVGDVRDVVRDGDTLTYTLVKPFFTATSASEAKPIARVTHIRVLFVRPPGQLSSPFLLVARASSTATAASCKTSPCLACRGLLCECPEPQCDLPEADPLDLAILDSLRVTT